MSFGTMMRAHPLETIFIVLVTVLLVSWAFGFAAGVSFFFVLFLGFAAALLFLLGGWAISTGKAMNGVILIAVGFGLVGAIGAGWVRF